MKISKYERYVSMLDKSIFKVEDAIKDGALLTEMEKLDFYFKKLLYGESVNKVLLSKDKTYNIACYYAWAVNELEQYRLSGYSNVEAFKFVKQLCKKAIKHRLCSRSHKVSSYDANGTLYIQLSRFRETLHTFEIRGMNDFTKSVLAIISYLASSGIYSVEMKEFVETYAVNIFNEIREVKDPTPYLYNGAAKTLRRFVTKSASTDKKEKIIQYRVG